MTNELQCFTSEFGNVRTIEKDGEPWFVAKDVCDCLDIGNVTQAISRLDADERGSFILNEGTYYNINGGNPNVLIISESGLYALVASSRKPQTKRFRRWINHEVLPQIRKTGGYIPANVEDDEQSILAKAYIIANKTLDMKSKELADAHNQIAAGLEREAELHRRQGVINNRKTATAMATASHITRNYNNLMSDYEGMGKEYIGMQNKLQRYEDSECHSASDEYINLLRWFDLENNYNSGSGESSVFISVSHALSNICSNSKSPIKMIESESRDKPAKFHEAAWKIFYGYLKHDNYTKIPQLTKYLKFNNPCYLEPKEANAYQRYLTKNPNLSVKEFKLKRIENKNRGN